MFSNPEEGEHLSKACSPSSDERWRRKLYPYNLKAVSNILKENDIINNVPAGQIKTVFNMIDKAEFMSVSGLERMGFNDEYLAGQQGDEFIIYKFGDDYIRVYNTEFEMNEDLNQLKQPINLKPIEAYQ